MASEPGETGKARGDDLLRPDTVRALDREHRDLIVSLRALATLLREPEHITAVQEEAILARILDAELNQVSVLDGEILTALRLEKGELGAAREVDLARVLRKVARRTGRLMAVETAEAVPVRAHPDIVEQEIASALAFVHRIADGPVRATAARRADGGLVSVRTVVAGAALSRARHDQRVALLHRMARAEGGRLVIERDAGDVVTLHLTFYDRD